MIANLKKELSCKAQALLTHQRLPVILAILAVFLTLPSLKTGLQLDDYFQKAMFNGGYINNGEDGSLFGQFSFLNGDSERNKFLMDIGVLPWWTFPGIKIAFFRPLTEVTHKLDYFLWPDSPFMMHLQSLLWFAGVIVASVLIYRRIMGPTWVAGFAALLYTVDYTHGIPVCWLANRNALLATFFGLLSLYFHDSWRKEGYKPAMLMAPFFFTLGLLSGEFAISAGAYLFAYMVCIDDGKWTKRILSILPYGIISLIWLFVRNYWNFGTTGSGMYIDPGKETALFVSSFFKRALILLEGQWGFIPSELYGFLPKPIAFYMLIFSIVLLAFIGLVLWPMIKNNSKARFWALGMVLSLVPIAATSPNDRLLLFAGLGAAGLMGQFIGAWIEKKHWLPSKKIWKFPAFVCIVFFIAFHLLISSVKLPFSSIGFTDYLDRMVNQPAVTLPLDKHFLLKKKPSLSEVNKYKKILKKTNLNVIDQDVVLINPPIAFFALQIPTIRYVKGLSAMRHLRVLASGLVPLEIKRTDENTLEIRIKNGHITTYLDSLFRGNGYPMKLGQKVSLTGMSAQVLSLTDDNRPQNVAFHFSRPLEDPSLKLLQWKSGKFVHYKPPAVGETTYLKAVR